MLHRWSLNSLFLSINLIPVSVSLTHLILYLPYRLFLLIHHSHPSLPYSFTPCFTPTCSTKPSHRRLSFFLSTASTDNYPGPFSSGHKFFFLLRRPLERRQSIVVSMSVCVCLSVRHDISGTTRAIFSIFCACCLCPWLGHPAVR